MHILQSKKISGQLKPVTPEDARKQIEYYLKNFKENKIEKEIAFFGGSFTAIDRKLQEELLKVAYEYKKLKKVQGIRLSTRPDCIDKAELKLLKKYGVTTIELGVQTTNDYLLKKCKRGHSFEDVKKASKLIRRSGFILGHQMMVGLPESTRLDELNTAKDLAKLKPKIMRIYPVLVIKGTELEQEYKLKKYEPLSVEQAVEICKELNKFFMNRRIEVIRIGLQNTDTITSPDDPKSEVIAGPYHECFRQLVESSFWYDKIVEKIKSFSVRVKKVEIKVNEKDVNYAVGYKRENIDKLEQIYNVKAKFVQDDKIKHGKLKINVIERYKDFIDE